MLGDILGDSKSMRTIYVGMFLCVLLVIVGMAVLVIWDKDPSVLILGGLAKLFGDTTGGVYRSVKVDAPVRHLQAQLEVEKQAKEADVPSPLLPNLTVPSRIAADPLGVSHDPS